MMVGQETFNDIYSLEKHFELVCNRHPHLKLLESQWRFDQELISKALQNISSTFPHYSRHDASHSRQIIVNIERMLGEKIKFLSATDTWLILEAAYNHDIGMIITQKQIDDLDSPDFNNFIKDIARQPDNSLYEFAQNWIEGKAKLPKGSAAHSFFHNYIFLLAEWYRRKHPENSAKIVNNPLNEIGLDSPRNELLPKRLFMILADICRSHGDSFDKLMKNLPFSEAGMATEDCHPRYIACLLRMGDLLDLDDNRFCPVMLKMCGRQLPHTSHAHLDKHHSIKHFRLDSERIEAESICPDPISYEVAYEWFKWLENEYHQQTQLWDEIVPCKELGRLPTLTTPIVQIQEPYLVLEAGKKPSFKVDQPAILELVRGTGLYPSKFDSIREILQNAVDASLIAAWEKHSKIIPTLNPTSSELNKILNDYKIEVDFDEHPKKKNHWILKIKDKGTGISLETLQYMLDVGSSYKNKKKINKVDVMPIWYRPSGNFGIGLQSAYLITDKFTIITKSRETNEALSIQFSKDTQKPIIIKKLENKNIEYGSIFETEIKVTKFPNTISWSRSNAHWLTTQLKEYDFTKKESNLAFYEVMEIYDRIANFKNESPIPINIDDNSINKNQERFFSDKFNIILSHVKFTNNDTGEISTLFRGQEFSDFGYYFYCLSAQVDFYGYNAKDFLTYNREKILPTAKSIARKDFVGALKDYIDLNFNNLQPEDKPNAAAFYLFNFGLDNIEGNKLKEHLLDFKVLFRAGHFLEIKQIFEDLNSGKILYLGLESHIQSQQPIINYSEEKYRLLLNHNCSSIAIRILAYFEKEKGLFRHISKEKIDNLNIIKHTWSASDEQPVDNDEIKFILSQKSGYINNIGNRLIFPCWGYYRKLAIIAKIKYANTYPYISYRNDNMVLPYTFNGEENQYAVVDTSEEFISWVFKKRKDKTVTLEEIRNLYNQLIQQFETILEREKPE